MDKKLEGKKNSLKLKFRRVPFEVVKSSFMLALIINKHLGNSGSELAKRVMQNLYEDNIVVEAGTTEALTTYKGLRFIYNSANEC